VIRRFFRWLTSGWIATPEQSAYLDRADRWLRERGR
jgi:hypothetical protein